MLRRFRSAKVRSANSQSYLPGAEIRPVQRRPVAQIVDPDFLDAVEILAPALVMAADLHLVDAGLAMVDRRDAVLDPGREHEVGDGSVSSICSLLPERPGRTRSGQSINDNPGTGCVAAVFRLRAEKAMRWADGFIAVDWGTTNRRAYRLDPPASRRRVRGRQGRAVGAQGGSRQRSPKSAIGSATCLCCSPEWPAPTAVGWMRPMSPVQPGSTIS